MKKLNQTLHCGGNNKPPKIIFIEPFYGGSHKALLDALTSNYCDYTIVSLPAKKWHWRARCGALIIQDLIPKITNEKILFCSSILNLAELLGVRTDLVGLKKIVYFHENQLFYPVREIKERDIQYAYNQIITCFAADIVLFNSNFNKTSFLDNIKKIIKMLPDFRPKQVRERIENKCHVLYFPMEFPKDIQIEKSSTSLHIVWPHRWEFDKGPEDFFQVLFKLKSNQVSFKVSILGESFTDNPPIFAEAKTRLKDEIINFGFQVSKTEYFQILASANVVVSTSKHEFFGVAMLEAAYCGCFPLVPKRLVYPEIYPVECLFVDLDDLYCKLKDFCLSPSSAIAARNQIHIDFNKYSSTTICLEFNKLLN